MICRYLFVSYFKYHICMPCFQNSLKTPIIVIAFSFMSRLVFFLLWSGIKSTFFVHKTLINREWKWHIDLKTQMFQSFISCIIGLLLL